MTCRDALILELEAFQSLWVYLFTFFLSCISSPRFFTGNNNIVLNHYPKIAVLWCWDLCNLYIYICTYAYISFLASNLNSGHGRRPVPIKLNQLLLHIFFMLVLIRVKIFKGWFKEFCVTKYLGCINYWAKLWLLGYSIVHLSFFLFNTLECIITYVDKISSYN